jgi:hypothetical protein
MLQHLRPVRPGQKPSAAAHNEIIRHISGLQQSSGGQFFAGATGLHARPECQPEPPECQYADLATTANIASLSGIATTVDGEVASQDTIVLVKDQTTPAENGLYATRGSDWEKIGQPAAVAVLNGTENGLKWWFLTAENVYDQAGGGGGTIVAQAASIAPVTLSGSQTVDGYTPANAETVLIKNQGTAADNGIYVVNTSGAWVNGGQPDVVAVLHGKSNRLTFWFLDGANQYTQAGSNDMMVVRVIGTSNIASLSGTFTHDGVALAVGDKVLAKSQTTAANRAAYLVQSGAWVNLGQPRVAVATEGTSNGRTMWILSAANTYSALRANYA